MGSESWTVGAGSEAFSSCVSQGPGRVCPSETASSHRERAASTAAASKASTESSTWGEGGKDTDIITHSAKDYYVPKTERYLED